MKLKTSLLTVTVLFALAGLAKLFLPGLPDEKPLVVDNVMELPAWAALFAAALVSLVVLLLLDPGEGQAALLARIGEIVTTLSPFLPKRPPPPQFPPDAGLYAQSVPSAGSPTNPPTPGVGQP